MINGNQPMANNRDQGLLLEDLHQEQKLSKDAAGMERSSSFEQRSQPQEQRLSQEGSQGLVGIEQSIAY